VDNFFLGHEPKSLLDAYGSPLYVYSERILRERCREIAGMIKYRPYKARYAAKANLNLSLLRVIREEGLWADATSAGEIAALFAAGFKADEILFTANNVSPDEMRRAHENGVMISFDSISQIEAFGGMFPGAKIAVRLNTGIGAGHHVKVVTGGDKTKFGVTPELWGRLKETAGRRNLKITGITQHIGSLFMKGEPYLEGVKALLKAAGEFEGLEFIDLGGGFGIPYHRNEGEPRLDIQALGAELDGLLSGAGVVVHVEPGRYISAECGVLLGTVNTVKTNGARKFVGTDIGFTVFARPVLYDAYHEIEVIGAEGGVDEIVTVVGNICESGDIIAKERPLPACAPGGVIAVMDAGAYGAAMASNYNNRPRPAEVLIREDGAALLTRRRDTFDDMLSPYINLN
jgi:diaminopimelate decarboxylase